MGTSLKTLGVLTALITFVTACGPKNRDSENGPQAPIGNIKVDSNIKTLHRNYLAQSVDYLDSLNYWPSQDDLSQITGLEHISSTSLHQWLEDRVQYIVASNFDPNKPNAGFYSNTPFTYENPDILPDIDSGETTNNIKTSDSSPQLLMQNLGVSIYNFGKSQRKLIGLNIPGEGPVLITSPLVGIIQLGTSLFPEEPVAPSDTTYILLLSIMFHEAHHSDGNGKSLGFFHAVCPAGHQYAGHAACDRNLNGPYKLQAIFLKSLIGNCAQCSVKQTEILKGWVADSLSRFLPTSVVNGKTVDSTEWDPRPEGHR